MLLDKYFKNPVLYDYLVSILISSIVYIVYCYCAINLPSDERSMSMTTDLSNIGLTSTGFILTLLTVLITFKSSSKVTKTKNTEDDSVFELFFASGLYFITVGILKNCIKSLILISVLGFSLKIGLPKDFIKFSFFYNIFGLIVIALTLYRCLLILTKILKMQE